MGNQKPSNKKDRNGGGDVTKAEIMNPVKGDKTAISQPYDRRGPHSSDKAYDIYKE